MVQNDSKVEIRLGMSIVIKKDTNKIINTNVIKIDNKRLTLNFFIFLNKCFSKNITIGLDKYAIINPIKIGAVTSTKFLKKERILPLISPYTKPIPNTIMVTMMMVEIIVLLYVLKNDFIRQLLST